MDYCELRIAPRDFPDPDQDLVSDADVDQVVLAGGCFWCVEAVFRRLNGVLGVSSGYAGGSAETADYQSVCSGRTDHAEVIRVDYDPRQISYGQLLKVFFSVAHDPTQLNRQGNDQGRQYRSAIFPANEEQHAVATAYIDQLNAADIFSAPIVTTLEPLETFFEAEGYHQDYAARNPGQPYILHVSTPKVRKLEQEFPEQLKSGQESRS